MKLGISIEEAIGTLKYLNVPETSIIKSAAIKGIEALEKQRPLECRYVSEDGSKMRVCPECNNRIGEDKRFNYCSFCGQRIL